MGKIYFILLLLFCGCKFSLECKVEVTKDFVYFGHCYNGLEINELEVKNDSIILYPSNYKKVSKLELLSEDSTVSQNQSIKVYFGKPTKDFKWKRFYCADYDPLKCFSDYNNYSIKDTINFFKPKTWYLFNFFNPHFELFVYCDDSEKVTFLKRNLNANF